ncbi:MAG: hypothetical protein R8G66_06615 [Cytophagales bacterium]|nr:hypothetical protein [Cytophagales bacterium]
MQKRISKLLILIVLVLCSISCKDDETPIVKKFELTSTNNNEQVIAAMEHALSIWESHLEIDVPIKVNVFFTPISVGFLGRSIPNGRRDFDGAPFTNIWYPSALANQLTGTELNEGEFDMDILMDGTSDWYYGTDGNPGPDQFDFVSVFLHEICHSLGFGSLADIVEGQGAWSVNIESDLYTPSFPIPDLENRPTIYDLFLENGLLFRLTDESRFGNPSFELTLEFTGGDLFWGGEIAQSANGDLRPQIYAPSTFRPGSSIGHLDEATYESGTSNALMTPTFQRGEVIHEPGPIILGALQDMGWTLKQ